MAQFKIGMRVRVVGCDNSFNRQWVGAEATIVGRTRENHPDYGERIWKLDIPDAAFGNPYMLAASCHISPAASVDEKADQFIARIKKLGSEPLNDAPKVTVREGK